MSGAGLGLLASVAVLGLFGCGNGGGNSGTVSVTPAPAVAPSLTSGTNQLTFPLSGTSYGLLVKSANSALLNVQNTQPVTVYVCQGAALAASSHTGTCTTDQTADPSAANTVSGAYSTVTQTSATQVTATASLSSPNGTKFAVSDVYTPAGTDLFTTSRTVTVAAIGTGTTTDTGFNSQFDLALSGTPLPIAQYHFMAPAVLYDQNATAPAGAIATGLANSGTAWYY